MKPQSCACTDMLRPSIRSCGVSSTLAKSGPASSSRTLRPGSSESREASTEPEEPAPTITSSYMSAIATPPEHRHPDEGQTLHSTSAVKTGVMSLGLRHHE